MDNALANLAKIDWGIFAAAASAAVAILAFLISPHTTTEMIGEVTNAFTSRSYYDNSGAMSFLLASLPAGLVARRCITAVVMIIAEVVFVASFNRFVDVPRYEDGALAIIGILLLFTFIGGLLRTMKVQYGWDDRPPGAGRRQS